MRADRLFAVALVVGALCACGTSEHPDVSLPSPDPSVAEPSVVDPSVVESPAVEPSAVDGLPAEPSMPTAADGCPDEVPLDVGAPWVPQPPTTQTPGRLVPDADPVEALVCRYRPGDGTQATLVGGVLLETGLNRIRTDLQPSAVPAGQGRPCPDGARVPHLMRLRYADGDLWLSATQAPGDCTASGNGAFVTDTYLGDRFAEAYESLAWGEA